MEHYHSGEQVATMFLQWLYEQNSTQQEPFSHKSPSKAHMCRWYVQKDYTMFATIFVLNKSLYENIQLPFYIHCWCIGAQHEFAWIFQVYMN
jgi:hypothetical protein